MELEPSRPVATFPPSLISPLCRIIFSLSLPLEPESSTLDPRPPPAGEEVARELLFSLALVSKEFYHAARPWLWRTLIIQRPRGWIGIVEKVGGSSAARDQGEEAPEATSPVSPRSRSPSSSTVSQGSSETPEIVTAGRRSQSIERTAVFLEAQTMALTRSNSLGPTSSTTEDTGRTAEYVLGNVLKRERSVSSGPRGRTLRDASQERIGRSRVRAISGMGRESSIHSVLEGVEVANAHPSPLSPLSICYPTSAPASPVDEGAVSYFPSPLSEEDQAYTEDEEEPFDPAEFYADLNEHGLPVRLLSFCPFRTTGLRRSLVEGISGRYVTSERLGLVLHSLGNLEAFGATEYMDSALSFSNLISIFFRGANRLPSALTHDSDEWAHLIKFRPLVALDLCGVNSRAFSKAMSDFVVTFLTDEDADPERGMLTPPQEGQELQPSFSRSLAFDVVRSAEKRNTRFDSLQRLSLANCKLPTHDLAVLLPRFGGLTVLDLSYTRADGSCIRPLESLHLRTLSLSRTKIDGADLVNFLNHPARSHLEELALFFSSTFPSPLSPDNLTDILTHSPAFLSGKLRYLDLSASAVTPNHLAIFPDQPNLISLGLSHIPLLSLRPLANFLLDKAPQVEILGLTNTSPEIVRAPNLASSMVALHALLVNPLAASPLSFEISRDRSLPPPPARTRLRVVELGSTLLDSLAKGRNTTWRVIRSKGARGWYVDTSAGSVKPGWVIGGDGRPSSRDQPPFELESEHRVYQRGIERDHGWRKYLEHLADCGGKVASNVGWHSRKAEVLRGEGLLGREEGLYGGQAFSFDE